MNFPAAPVRDEIQLEIQVARWQFSREETHSTSRIDICVTCYALDDVIHTTSCNGVFT